MKLALLALLPIFLASPALSQDSPSAPAQDSKAEKEDLGLNAFNVASSTSCIRGHNPFAKNTTENVRAMAETTLAKYILLAGGSAGANAMPAYTNKDKTFGWERNYPIKKKVALSWILDGRPGSPTAVDDPIARDIAKAGTDSSRYLHTDSFLIAGAKLNAMGLWRVSDPAHPDATIGWYKAQFMRQNSLGSQRWDLISLEVTRGPTAPAALRQFCYEPGDVEANRAWEQQEKEKRARKKAGKSQ